MNKKKMDEWYARLDEAERRYTPRYMMSYLKREDDGTVVVDRDRAFDMSDNTQASNFYWILQCYYQTRSKTMLNSTIYYEDAGDVIYAGCYDIVNKKKLSRKPLISVVYRTPYICTEKVLQEFKKALLET